MKISDKERLNTISILTSKEGVEISRDHLFSPEKLNHIRPLGHRLGQVMKRKKSNMTNNISIKMLRRMIDEVLLEVTAQVNWSLSKTSGASKRKIMHELGLTRWESMTGTDITLQSKVA